MGKKKRKSLRSGKQRAREVATQKNEEERGKTEGREEE
jgi:hypothetical protein